MQSTRLTALMAVGLIVWSVILLIVGFAPVTGASSPDCSALAPSTNPATNVSNIESCLSQPAPSTTILTAGTYPINGTLTVPSNASLLGSGMDYPTIKLVSPVTRMIIVSGNNARVGLLRLNANSELYIDPNPSNNCCIDLLQIQGSNDLVDDSFISGALGPGITPGSPTEQGVYILCNTSPYCSGDSLLRDQIFNNSYGVLFNDGGSSSNPNTVTASSLYENGCAGVAFIGYGVVNGDSLYGNGAFCPGYVPGNGVYAGGDPSGGLVESSNIYDNCGNDVDLYQSQNFTIANNTGSYPNPGIYNPGYGISTPPMLPCSGKGLSMVNVANSTVSNNNIQNTGNSNNTVDKNGNDPNQVYEASGAQPFSDLPNNGHVAIAFELVYSAVHEGTLTMGNSITGNTFVGNCSNPCVGLGYFSSRDAGYGPGFSWSASTTNYYTDNNPIGSNIGSLRGGANWYAANNACYAGSVAPCNSDDYQHSGLSNDWARNDKFYVY